MLDLQQLQEHVRALQVAEKTACQKSLRALKAYKAADWAEGPDAVVHPLVEALVQILASSREAKVKLPAAVRQDAVTLLGALGGRAAPAVAELAELLQRGVAQNLREAAVSALGKIGPAAEPVVDQLIALLDEECPVPLAARVASALADIGAADAHRRAALAKVWRLCALYPESRLQVAVALARLDVDVPGLVSFLIANLRGDASPALRRTAVEALGWRGTVDQDVVPAVTVALYDSDEEVCRLAEAALVRMGLSSEQALALCGQRLSDSPLAETALRKSGPPAVAALIAALGDEEPPAREKAARVLSTLGDAAAEAAPALTALLGDPDRDVRLAAAKALWGITGEAGQVVRVLSELLTTVESATGAAGDERRQYVQTVIEALARIGRPAKAAIPALVARRQDENRLIREAALRALKDIDPVAAVRAAAD